MATWLGTNQFSGLTREERFWAKVDVRGPEECWPWLAATNGLGYGQFGWEGRGRPIKAHRAALLLAGIEIPDGMVPDHLCHTRDRSCPGGPECPHRQCVNLRHLEIVTIGENISRVHWIQAAREATHCRHDHPWAENGFINSQGYRACLECRRQSKRKAS